MWQYVGGGEESSGVLAGDARETSVSLTEDQCLTPGMRAASPGKGAVGHVHVRI